MKFVFAPLASVAAAAAMSVSTTAHRFPAKTITLVVPTSAGGGNDAMARTIAQKLGPWLDQTDIR